MSSTESKFKTRGLLVLVWIVILALGFFGYKVFKHFTAEKLEEETGSVSLYKHEISVYADSFTGYCILRSSEMQNNLKKDNIKLTITDDSKSKDLYFDRLKALKNGKADMAVFTVDSELVAGIVKLKGEFPASIVMIIDETRGADAIVAKGVKSIQDLNRANAKFVLTPNSPSEFLARIAKAYFNLPNLPDKWIIEADGAEDVYKRFKKDSGFQPRAYVLWEPYVSKALEEPGAVLLFGSDKLKAGIVDILVTRRKFLKDNPDLVKAFVKSYLSAAYAYQNNMVDLVIKDARAAGERLSEKDAENIVKGIQWKNTLENYAHFGLLSRKDASGLEYLEDIITKIADVLVATGVFSQSDFDKIQPSSLFYTGIMEELQKESFHPGKLGSIVKGDQDSLDKVRGDVKLSALTDEQWNQLMPVAEMRMERLAFRRGTAELGFQSIRHMQNLATRLKSMPQYYLYVVGNARAEGDVEANKALAKARAEVAAQHLILRLGVNRSRIKTIAAEPSLEGGAAQSVTFRLGQRPY